MIKWSIQKEDITIIYIYILYIYIYSHTYKVKESESRSVVSDSLRLYSPWNSPFQNAGVGSLSLLQGIFPARQSNPGLLYYRWIIYQLSHKGSPRMLEWVAYLFSSRSPQLRNFLHYRQILNQLSYQGSYYIYTSMLVTYGSNQHGST